MKKSDKSSREVVLYLRAASQDGVAEQRAVCTQEAERLGAVVIDEFVDAGTMQSEGTR
jgi:hypothetical protein